MHLLVKLEDLSLSRNQFTGQIPESLGDLSKLHELNLDNNKLEGSVPTHLGKLTIMGELHLNDNALEGEMPEEVCGLKDRKLHLLISDCESGDITCECCTRCH